MRATRREAANQPYVKRCARDGRLGLGRERRVTPDSDRLMSKSMGVGVARWVEE